ncbi:MAG: choline ABC transporter ATP-binding protein [Geminicoccaceae bacterium]|nr:choline ABC transporter ATP-binding protein [Geminicoccaceae bacterium]
MQPQAVAFKNVDIFFGPKPKEAARLAREGQRREDILKTTGTVLGVTDCTLDVAPGEVCVLMGLSGSGKSTLLRAVNGLNPVTSGEVLVADGDKFVNVAACKPRVLRGLRRRRVAMVFQQFGLLPWATVAENVGLGLELRGTAAAERGRIVKEKLDLVGLSNWADKRIEELSGGMQQRVGLARAFATDADVLLMDEPFSALDPLIRSRLQDELLDLQRQLKKTIVFVSHDLDEAIKLGSRIAIMEGGRVVQYGTPEAIVLDPATDYVAAFVAHMNPLKVLRAGALMTPKDRLQGDAGARFLDDAKHGRVVLGDDGEPVAFEAGGRPAALRSWGEGCLEGLNGPTFVWAGPDLLMEDAIRIREATGLPVLVVENDRLQGVVGDAEIYASLLHRVRPREKKQDMPRAGGRET